MWQRMVVRSRGRVVVWWTVGMIVGMVVVVVLHVSLLSDLVWGWQLNELWLEYWHQVLDAANICERSAQPDYFLLELIDGPAIEGCDVVVFHGLQVGERRDERRGVVLFHNPIASGWPGLGFGWQGSGSFERGQSVGRREEQRWCRVVR